MENIVQGGRWNVLELMGGGGDKKMKAVHGIGQTELDFSYLVHCTGS